MKRIPEFLLVLSWCAMGISIAADPPSKEKHDHPPAVARQTPDQEPADRPAAIRGELVVPPYKLVRQSADNVPAKSGVLWRVRPLDDRNEVDWASKQNGRNIEWVAPPGRYRVELYVVRVLSDGTPEMDLAETMVTIGDAPPPGPGPGPGPGPTPPADPFARGIWDAYQQETTPTKAADAAAWSAVFRAAIGHIDAVNYRTALDLQTDLKTALAATRPGALPKLRPLVMAEMVAAFGTDPTSPLNKPAAKAELQKIADALGGLR